MFFRQIFDPTLAQYSYMIGCQSTNEALVIDPMRDVETYIDLAAQEGFEITAVTETHIHADYLSGARELAERTGAVVYLSGEGGDDWKYGWEPTAGGGRKIVHNGDTLRLGRIRFDVLHTPGHTPEHICFVVTDRDMDRPMGIFTGDFVVVGDVGRPDLLETAAGQVGAMEPSARDLFHSIKRFGQLAHDLQLWPAHGAGSACGKALGAVPMSTVGYELVANQALLAATDEDSFVTHILDGQPEPPLYFGRMKEQNKSGPAILGKIPTPRLMRQAKLEELVGATGVAVLDTRRWDQYRAAHLPGAMFTPLDRNFNTTAGSYVPDGMPIYLIIEESQLKRAVVDLIRVGLDNIVEYATPDMFADTPSTLKKASVAEVDAAALEEHLGEDTFILDVRRASEIEAFGRIEGSHNIAHTRLFEHLDELPKDKPIVVHCQGGGRSAYAAGLLDRHGFKVTNVAGGFGAWQKAGGAVSKV